MSGLNANAIINDPTYTPLAVGSGNPLATNPGTSGRFIVVATTLRVRYLDATDDANRTWLNSPTKYVRGGGRP